MSAVPNNGQVEYLCQTTDRNSWIAVRFFYWPKNELKNLLEKIIGKENLSKLDDGSYICVLGLKGDKECYNIFFSQIDQLGWNSAIEISGRNKSIVAQLDMYFCLCLKFMGFEISELINDLDEHKITKKKRKKTIEFCSICLNQEK